MFSRFYDVHELSLLSCDLFLAINIPVSIKMHDVCTERISDTWEEIEPGIVSLAPIENLSNNVCSLRRARNVSQFPRHSKKRWIKKMKMGKYLQCLAS